MKKKNKYKSIDSDKGQALFEFIIFLPVLLIFYGIIVSIGTAINGSINQQKATRGFAMAQIKGSPNIPARRVITRLNEAEQITQVGMFTFLWAGELRGETPVTACYRVPLFGSSDDEECDIDASAIGESSPMIRPMTAFGICGATYVMGDQNDGKIIMTYRRGAQKDGCLTLKEN